MDEADLAQERAMAFQTDSLSTREPGLKSPNGMCIWCKDEPVVPNSAFCSADCGEDYLKRQREINEHT